MKPMDIIPAVLEGVAAAATAGAEFLDYTNSVAIAEVDDWNDGVKDFSIALRMGKTREIKKDERIPKSATIIYTGKDLAWSDAPETIPEENTVRFRNESAYRIVEYIFKFKNIKEGTLDAKLINGKPWIEFEADEDIGITVKFRQQRNTNGVERYYFQGFDWYRKKTGDMFLYYGDCYFDRPATEYNPQLMTLAMNLELAACIEEEDPTKRSNSIQKLLWNLGFSDIYVNDVYTSLPTMESTDVAVALKKINGCNLIFLVLSGAHYSVEFASNLMIGRSGDHTGFAQVGEEGLRVLRKFIQDRGITGRTKILVAGYSRTAAGGNLLARNISDSIADGTVKEFIGDIELAQDDFYGLFFETPLCGYYNENEGYHHPEDPRYNSIWYTTNPDDPVTYIPTATYGFVRYGHRIILNPDHDPELNRAMLANIKAYVAKTAENFYDMSRFKGYGGFKYMEEINVGFEQKFFDTLGSREFYYDEVQEDIVKMVYVGYCNSKVLMDIVRQTGGIVKSLIALNNYKDDYNEFVANIRPNVEASTQRYGYEEYTDNIVNALYQITCLIDRYSNGNIIAFVKDSYFRSMLRNPGKVVKAHYPAMTLSYLMLEDEYYVKPYVEEDEEEEEEEPEESLDDDDDLF